MTATPSQSKALRRIFLTIFLRGRAARQVKKDTAPKSIASKLALTLVFYGAFGCFATFFAKQSLFALSVYLHASTLMFIGMFVATSAGETLFNKEEADILLHRPIAPRALLWAKISVIVQISLWVAGAFNIMGLVMGTMKAGLPFLLAHVVSVVMEALFCVGAVVVLYQLCLRWFGRERLDGIITTMQTFMAIAIVLGSQLAPQFLIRSGPNMGGAFDSWWVLCLPPAWFAGFDDAIAGTHALGSWAMAGLASAAMGLVLWAGFGTLARDYEAGLQTIQEIAPIKPGQRARGRWIERLILLPPFRWWLKDSITRAAFLLSTAYLTRDRDVKLRVYPGLAPILIMPIIFLMPNRGRAMMGDFGMAFSGTYLGLLPLLGLGFLKYSQQWQAADIFRVAPIPGPAPLCHGARKAILFLIATPMLVALCVAAWFFGFQPASMKMLLPGILSLPIFAMIPCFNGDAVPLSEPPEEAKQAARGLQMMGVMFLALVLAGLAMFANSVDLFWWFLILEVLLVSVIYAWMRAHCAKVKWQSTN